MAITKASSNAVAPAAKGDLVVGSATNDAAVLGVGTNDQVLTADSSTATGLKWATASSGGMTLLASGSLTSTNVTLSSISSAYKDLLLLCHGWTNSAGNGQPSVDIASGADLVGVSRDGSTNSFYNASGGRIYLGTANGDRTNANNGGYIYIYNYASTTVTRKPFHSGASFTNVSAIGGTNFAGTIRATGAIDAITIYSDGTFNGGTYILYGVK
jgi:hypothetical protein